MHRGFTGDLCFYRDHRGEEVDLIVGREQCLLAIEVKSGQTLPSDAFRSLQASSELVMDRDEVIESISPILVDGGKEAQNRSDARVMPWRKIMDFDWVQV